ncbi:hypothetical protein RvY_18675 [Ramazzottius varieornatus]|uniref:Uncharacterized protein n=1 Tax=Ramazzottius varieornatus TaxID=947166 RepID=A0A1D1W6M8_RAMVA|nr:hypothetical protein RvY_18675 [Ramazzottius varieornatus]
MLSHGAILFDLTSHVKNVKDIPLLAVFWTFIGLEYLGVIASAFAVINGITGVLTNRETASFHTRKGIFLLDYILSLTFSLGSFGMLCGSLLAASIYIYIAMLIGTTPYVYELMAFFNIPILPVISLIALKGCVMATYFILFILSISAAVSNRRNRPTE